MFDPRMDPRNQFMNDLYQQIQARRGLRPAMDPMRQIGPNPIPRVKPTISTVDDSGMGPGIPKALPTPYTPIEKPIVAGPVGSPSPYTPPAFTPTAITQPLAQRKAISGGGRPGVGSEGGFGTVKAY